MRNVWSNLDSIYRDCTVALNINSVDAGEKMGLQITVLLADIIYVEVLQSTVPVFDSLGTDKMTFGECLVLLN